MNAPPPRLALPEDTASDRGVHGAGDVGCEGEGIYSRCVREGLDSKRQESAPAAFAFLSSVSLHVFLCLLLGEAKLILQAKQNIFFRKS